MEWEEKSEVQVDTPPVPEPGQEEAHKWNAALNQNYVKLWGLNQSIDLIQEASDFYLLYDLHLEEQDEGLFEPLQHRLLKEFVGYTDMAVGGELRHAGSKSITLAPPLRAAMGRMIPHNRHRAWVGWYAFRLRYGTLALHWAEDGFKGFKGGGYGGPKWANIAHMLRLHLEDDLPPIAFIDTCWGLQHNGGCYFNKAYKIGEKWVGPKQGGHAVDMNALLDANRESDYKTLQACATPEVGAMHKKKIG